MEKLNDFKNVRSAYTYTPKRILATIGQLVINYHIRSKKKEVRLIGVVWDVPVRNRAKQKYLNAIIMVCPYKWHVPNAHAKFSRMKTKGERAKKKIWDACWWLEMVDNWPWSYIDQGIFQFASQLSLNRQVTDRPFGPYDTSIVTDQNYFCCASSAITAFCANFHSQCVCIVSLQWPPCSRSFGRAFTHSKLIINWSNVIGIQGKIWNNQVAIT